MESEIDQLREERLDYDLLKQNFHALEEYAHKLEAELETIKQSDMIARSVEFNSSLFRKRAHIDSNKYIPNFDEYVPIKSHKEVCDKLLKERIKNEKLKDQLSDMHKKNNYLTLSNKELMKIFETFLRATATTKQSDIEDAIVMPNTISSIPKCTKTQDLMIDSQFKSLEDYAKGYNVLQTCLETSSFFKKLIGEYKEKVTAMKKYNL